MLTLKLLRENPEFVISKLAVKNFDAREIVEKIIGLDQNRRALQTELDACLAEQKKKASQIGGLMKEGRREEAETVKAEVAALKARSAEIEKTSQENNAELEEAKSQILALCKAKTEAGIAKTTVYRLISELNGGNRNPNSITNMEIATQILHKLEELNG